MRSQVESYLQKQMVEEALILAETIAAVEQGKNNPDAMAKAEEVRLGKRAILVLLLFVSIFCKCLCYELQETLIIIENRSTSFMANKI